MLRMSFLGHLEELRTRLIRMLMGVGVAFVASLTFSDKLWLFVQEPAHNALMKLGVKPPNLVAIDPMDQFNIIWVKLPILAAIFLSSPWIIYQIWGFHRAGLVQEGTPLGRSVRHLHGGPVHHRRMLRLLSSLFALAWSSCSESA